ncbi:hypothetical protein [Psychroserpens jangbogonensis]|uniref:hypothetical protein n=1 Tax=Psychroserpens jangbogonensis TaxID=1484460 RepID=UPI001269D090|nr:hypothetical protein [Psychroserpens jangbogonensis]
MKHLTITFALLLITSMAISQEKNIETKSVSIENLISFIVDHIESKTEDSELPTENITFLLQTPANDLLIEHKVILNQAFKLVSKRLTEEDYISIITYTGFNGIALNQTSPKDLKLILYTIENLKLSVKEFYKDGIELAYEYTNENFMEDSINTVIMIRNPKAIQGEHVTVQNAKAAKKNNVVLITAMALLPEIISVIKD